MTSNTEHRVKMRLAHVLFMDIVAYSQLPTDQQSKVLKTLQDAVRGTAEVKRAQSADQLITLATGDGMALVFFNDPMAPVQCAVEISKALIDHPEIKLRMGVHSGPVDEIVDVNDKANVAGAGINMAQRVMDSGDAGHILVSRRVAEDLAQYSSWQPFLHDLKEVEVKHGVRVHLFNLYTGDAGNAALPQKVIQHKKRGLNVYVLGIAAIVLIGLIVGLVLVKRRSGPPARVLKPESEFQAAFRKKTNAWVADAFATQAANGGMRSVISDPSPVTQVWTTAQVLVAVLSSEAATQKNLDQEVPKIKSAFDYISKLRRTGPAEGWNYYGNTIPYTVTEVNAWVTLAYIMSLDSKTRIWNDNEREEILNRVGRDLAELASRQDPTGGWRPIKEGGPDFTRTYPTVVVMWSLATARTSPSMRQRIGSQYDERIRGGIGWLLQNYKEGQGWVQNPNRRGQKDHFDGLTGQTLYVLSLVEMLPETGYIRNDQTYRNAKRDFINNRQLAKFSIEKDNSHIPDSDISFAPTEFMSEGSTFLWFPWSLLALHQLSADQSLSAEERQAATQLRLEILNANAEKLENYVETANLTYVLAENLFCVGAYLSPNH